MRLTRRQLKSLVENYLREQDSVMDDVEEEEVAEDPAPVEDENKEPVEEETPEEDAEPAEPEIPDTVEFKVSTDDGDVNISLRRQNDSTNHIIYIDEKRTSSANAGMDLQIMAAHGYIHPDTNEETKKILQKILNRDGDFKGKNESGILAVISDKMSARLGMQGYSKDNLSDILNKG